MKIASIVGARPEFVQAAMVSRALRRDHDEVLIHTGQHYDDLMSDVFFRQLQLPEPDVNLNVGSGSPSEQTSELLSRLAQTLAEIEPDVVVVRGDTNSTLAGALAARQNAYPLAHIESGMRSYNTSMPEENNRVVADHLSDLLFATGSDAVQNLAREGLTENVYLVGDVMYDTYLRVMREVLPSYRTELELPGEYDLLTIHRAGNTDDAQRLQKLIAAFACSPRPVIFPAHPRTAKRIRDLHIEVPHNVRLMQPFSYLDMLVAERGARTIFTDSGGVQREAYFGGTPCVTLREETEWTQTVDAGWNRLVGADAGKVADALLNDVPVPPEHPALFGDGTAAEKIMRALEKQIRMLEHWSGLRRRSRMTAT